MTEHDSSSVYTTVPLESVLTNPIASGLYRWSRRLDWFIEKISQSVAWLTLVLVLLVAFDVGARYLFHRSWVAEQELEWHILAVIAMMAAAYTLQQGEHVRVDVFYQYYSDRVKMWMDALFPLLIVIPVGLTIAFMSVHFFQMAYAIGEGSPDPGGLPYRWVIKAFIPLGFLLVSLQGVVMTIQAFVHLYQHDKSEK
ncbi:TRAP transporter small permease subunit [Halothiobacillus neapolitanus]|uniref:TRAP transporter small permease protein n=1 Tax=Halothiobacillus neapolitanus (strain ATCC 23641 / DSM 15147 / CIP 104769 / NCIMB 8539 / c2) TaxID=555778 RepID=D0KZ03_HALNC|nr:TRAP transporter small permease subunit [Halothiobacillus neapolitanus]ACX95676.1 Tripartite ATP-independent periplasmic transporter DctQ component [Halothiobacillus neapolitanus c2]TDN65982.1 TRAP-type mannitol/chloroaromatic compound transport system permease small subunit [Halothiobacillus neapolitanus]